MRSVRRKHEYRQLRRRRNAASGLAFFGGALAYWSEKVVVGAKAPAYVLVLVLGCVIVIVAGWEAWRAQKQLAALDERGRTSGTGASE